MKNKKIKTGLIAAIGTTAFVPGCMTGTRSDTRGAADSIRLEQMLKQLAENEFKGKLAQGAMCYVLVMLEGVDYTCPYCGGTTAYESGWSINGLDEINEIFNNIKSLGYDVVLDKTEYCQHCNKEAIEDPAPVFKIRFSPQSEYHEEKSGIINEYKCLLAFLKGRKKYIDRTDEEHAIHDNIEIIQKMTGLGENLEIEQQLKQRKSPW